LEFIEIEENEWVLKKPNNELSIHNIIEFLYDEPAIVIEELIEFTEKYPQHIDALHHLAIAYEIIEQPQLAYLFCQAAVSLGLQSLPDKFNWSSANINWGHLTNRPFIRAYHALGLHYFNMQLIKEATTIFEHLVSVCPYDNIGARYELIICYEQLKDTKNINKLCQRYPDEDLYEG